MDYVVSARKYRPQTFASVVGQHALTTTLKNAIATGKLAHAYLFCGPRGVGKTTCARIFAKTINCLTPGEGGEACNECESCRSFNEGRSLNIHELDAASNNSVDDIRQLVDQVRIPPQIGRYKVYIIDEVHMLSSAAFNAFLKTLEEPPGYAIFILATTEKHKILPTILSRCQIYDFARMTVEDMVAHLAYVASKEGYTAEPEALNVIALKADGGMRDALSIFDQVVSFTGGHIDYQSVIENLNVLDYDYYFRLTDYSLEGRVSESLLLLNEVLNRGFDGAHFVSGLASHLRDLLVSRDPVTLPLLEVGASIREHYKEQAARCPRDFLFKAMKIANDCELTYRNSRNKRLQMELALIQMAQITGAEPTQEAEQPTLKAVKASPPAQPTTPATQAPQPPAPTAEAQPAATQKPVSRAAPTPAPPAQAAEPGKKRNVAKVRPTISIKPSKSDNKAATKDQPAETATVVEENEPVSEDDLNRCWMEYALALPREQTALSKRMQVKQLKLNDDLSFTLLVDNKLSEDEYKALAPDLLSYMRRKLHNGRLNMNVVVDDKPSDVRVYGRTERYEMMAAKNEALQQLRETFGLEFS